MNWLKSDWWKSDLFVSSLFGSFIATIYTFSLFLMIGKLKYDGLEDFLMQLLSSVLPLWTLLFVFVIFIYKLTKGTLERWLAFLGFSEKAYVGFGTLIYVACASFFIAIAYLMSLSLFNSFAIISVITVGLVFTNSMSFALGKLKKMEVRSGL